MKWLLVGVLALCVACKKDPTPDFAGPQMEPQAIADPFVSDEPPSGSGGEDDEDDDDDDGPTNTDSIRDDGKKSKAPERETSIAKVEEISVVGAMRATITPSPGREIALSKSARGVLVTLAELSKTTKPELLIEKRSGSPKRESLDQMEVVGACQKGICVDGLRDQKTKTFLLPNQPSQVELDAAANGWVERLIRVASVGESHASVYLGRFSMQGSQPGQALLECATFKRYSNGKRLSLSEVLAPEQASAKIREAQRALQEKYPLYTIDSKSFLVMGAVPKGIWLCALPPAGSNEATIIEMAL